MVAVLSSLGIWANLKISGYVFALVNLVGIVLYASLHLGFFEVHRQFTFRSAITIAVLAYCIYAGILWARSTTVPDATAG